MGFRRIKHLELDDVMDNIRNTAEFKEIVSEYSRILAEQEQTYLDRCSKEASENEIDGDKIIAEEIQMEKQYGGTYEVPCSINGLALNMILDTGASDITISPVEANFMLKNGYLSDTNIKGKRQYLNTSGKIREGTVIITICEVKIGDSVIKNVDASVVHNQMAPLLFGESALSKFGRFIVVNNSLRLIIGK